MQKKEKNFYSKQLTYELFIKTNDPPDFERISSLIKEGGIDITLSTEDNLSIIEQLELASHISEKHKKYIIDIFINLSDYNEDKFQ